MAIRWVLARMYPVNSVRYLASVRWSGPDSSVSRWIFSSSRTRSARKVLPCQRNHLRLSSWLLRRAIPKTLATATVNRLLHHAHIVITEGTKPHPPVRLHARQGT